MAGWQCAQFARPPLLPILLLVLQLAPLDGGVTTSPAPGAAGNSTANDWMLVPRDELAVVEALEYSLQRINEMRLKCGAGAFKLAPLSAQNYEVFQVYFREFPMYAEYLLHIVAKYDLAPSEIRVHVARQKTASDLSLFEVIAVKPMPCALYSLLDDAALMLPVTADAVQEAQKAALTLLNKQRNVLCPQRPQLQLFRVIAATLQPVEGKVVRLVFELRESSTSFSTHSFTDVVEVVYALDRAVPVECTTAPEVYPARPPCSMKYTAEEQNAGEDQVPDGTSAVSNTTTGFNEAKSGTEVRRLLAMDVAPRPARRLIATTSGMTDDSELLRNYHDTGLEIPDSFDPRIDRTICYPRGISRLQGSCGSSWAFAATAVASFRECLHDMKVGDASRGLRMLSAQELVSCLGRQGCSGGDARSAFYHMKYKGLARESCSPYRMRCFIDSSVISVSAGDLKTSAPEKKKFQDSPQTCSLKPNLKTAPCRCLANVFHLTEPVNCASLPYACDRVRIPHYFRIAGTAEGNTVPEIERHMMQELFTAGPLYVSFLMYEDMFDPVSWTESGIYIHKHGDLIGKHAATVIGWGTDSESRDYWLLLNSYGDGWQQQGYFKLLRGETMLQMMKFGAWGVDFSHPEVDNSKPNIFAVEVSFSSQSEEQPGVMSMNDVVAIWLEVYCKTDEPAEVLVRIQGLQSTIMGEARTKDYRYHHTLRINLLALGLLGEHAKLQLYGVDKAENTGSWGPYDMAVPSKEVFAKEQQQQALGARRLVKLDPVLV